MKFESFTCSTIIIISIIATGDSAVLRCAQ